MTEPHPPATVRALVVTPDFLEAEDLIEELALAGLTPAVHVQKVSEAEQAMVTMQPQLIILGTGRGSDDFVARVQAAGIGLVVLNGVAAVVAKGRTVCIARPFESSDIQAAIASTAPAQGKAQQDTGP